MVQTGVCDKTLFGPAGQELAAWRPWGCHLTQTHMSMQWGHPKAAAKHSLQADSVVLPSLPRFTEKSLGVAKKHGSRPRGM